MPPSRSPYDLRSLRAFGVAWGMILGCGSTAPAATPIPETTRPEPGEAPPPSPPPPLPQTATAATAPPRACDPGGTLAALAPGGAPLEMVALDGEMVGHIEEVRCGTSERDAACAARATKEVGTRLPQATVRGTTVGELVETVRAELEIDGQRETWTARGPEEIAARASEASKAGHRVRLLSSDPVGPRTARAARVLVELPFSSEDRRTRLRVATGGNVPGTVQKVQALAAKEGAIVVSYVPRDDGAIDFVVACQPPLGL